MRRKRLLCIVAGLCLSVIMSRDAGARLGLPVCTLDAADAVVVGKIQEIKKGRTVKTRWPGSVHGLHATVEILRSFDDHADIVPAAGTPITLIYFGDYQGANMDGPDFPHFEVGKVYLLPLKRPGLGQVEWSLSGEEDWGSLVECRAEPPTNQLPIATMEEFSAAEMAATLLEGTYVQACAVGRSLGFGSPVPPERVTEMVHRMAPSEEQWFRIALACYSGFGLPRPTIVDLVDPAKTWTGSSELVATGLRSVPPDTRDERIIHFLVENLQANLWGASTILSTEYPTHPETVKQIGKSLDEGIPGSLYAAGMIIHSKEHLLVPAAIRVAVPIVRGPFVSPTTGDMVSYQDFRSACAILGKYAEGEQLEVLIKEFARSQKADRPKYLAIWDGASPLTAGRVTDLLRIAINDNGRYGTGRMCEHAAWVLQEVTGEDLGIIPSEDNGQARRKAVRKAREILGVGGIHSSGGRLVLLLAGILILGGVGYTAVLIAKKIQEVRKTFVLVGLLKFSNLY